MMSPMRRLLSFAAAAVLAVEAAGAAVAAPAAAPTPFAIGTFAPLATPAPFLNLPPIGSTRSAPPVCSVYRQLVLPSVIAALRADSRFGEARAHLQKFGDHLDDRFSKNGRAMFAHQTDQDVMAIYDHVTTIGKALGDPRLRSNDPGIVAQRTALQTIYDAEQTRANLLAALIAPELARGDTRLGEDEYKNEVDARAGQLTDAFGRPATPAPTMAPYESWRVPALSGNADRDRHAIEDWSRDMTVQVRAIENQAAPALIAIGKKCV